MAIQRTSAITAQSRGSLVMSPLQRKLPSEVPMTLLASDIQGI